VLVLHFETLKRFKTQFELWFLGNCWQFKHVTEVPKVVIGNNQNNFKIPFLGSFNVVIIYLFSRRFLFIIEGTHYMLFFFTTCVKEDIVWELYREGALIFLFYYYLKCLISTCFNDLKFDLNFIFALNFDTINLYEFLILIEGMRNDEIKKDNCTWPKKHCA